MFGGNLLGNDVFKHILSIGYEFETHDFTKLSLNDDNKLIHSFIVPRLLNVLKKEYTAVQVDDNYYEMMDNDLFFKEYIDEPIYELGKTKKNYNANLNIMGDSGTTDFQTILSKKCKDTDDKDSLYQFITNDKTKYKINFTERSKAYCSGFQGVEYIVTFYKPKIEKNIILETFFYACNAIINHLKSFKKIEGKLLLNGKSLFENVKPRYLFNKPNTNLYYLQTNDVIGFEENYFTLGLSGFVPQMTFRTHIIYLLPIMKEIVLQKDYTVDKLNKKTIHIEYLLFVKLEECILLLLKPFKLNLSKNKQIILKTLLVMIIYKIYTYTERYLKYNKNDDDKNDDDEIYLKDFISFNSRHTNYDYYKIIIGLIGKQMFFNIINQPLIISQFMLSKKPDVFTTHLEINDLNYGNPSISWMSYFLFFENPTIKENLKQPEWFLFSGLDSFSNIFNIPNDGTVLIENRYFYNEMASIAKTKYNIPLLGYPTLNKFKLFYKKSLEDKLVKPITHKIKKTKKNQKTHKH